jgi:PhnB protein
VVVQRITPYLLYEDVVSASEWLARAFGFREVLRTTGGAGGVHLEMEIDDEGTRVYAGSPPSGYENPRTVGRTALMYVLVEDVDAHHARAKEAGAEIVEELTDTPFGHRRYTCNDPEGHQWSFAAPIAESS